MGQYLALTIRICEWVDRRGRVQREERPVGELRNWRVGLQTSSANRSVSFVHIQ